MAFWSEKQRNDFMEASYLDIGWNPNNPSFVRLWSEVMESKQTVDFSKPIELVCLRDTGKHNVGDVYSTPIQYVKVFGKDYIIFEGNFSLNALSSFLYDGAYWGIRNKPIVTEKWFNVYRGANHFYCNTIGEYSSKEGAIIGKNEARFHVPNHVGFFCEKYVNDVLKSREFVPDEDKNSSAS